MKELFGNLYDSITKDNLLKEQFTEPIRVPYLTSFTTVKGNKYDQNRIKFMLVGRAVNGWGEKRFYGELLSRDEFVSSSIDNLNTEEGTVSSQGNDRFEWIGEAEEYGAAPKNRYRKRIDQSETSIKETPYSLSRAIWSYPKEVWCELTGYNTNNAWKDRWYENIVWSNLYKVAPTFGGNPDARLKKAQFKACCDLLVEEIEKFKPTHILFATGYDEWFDEFDKELGNPCKLVENYKDKDQMVEATGEFFGAKFVVSKRPEMKGKDRYVQAVIAGFEG